MKKSLSLSTLDSRIYSIFTLLVFATIFVVQLVSFRFTVNAVRTSTLENSKSLLSQLVVQIDSYISGMDEVSEAVAQDLQIRQYLTGDDGNIRDIKLKLSSYLQARTDISNILILGAGRRGISGDQEMEINPWSTPEESDWYLAAHEAGSDTVVSSSYVQNLYLGQYSWVVSISRTITSPEDNSPIGVLLVDLKFNRIRELCQSMTVGRKGYSFILDASGNYVFHPTQQLVYSDIRQEPLQELKNLIGGASSTTYSDGERHFTVLPSSLTGWHMVNVTYNSDIVTDWRILQLSYTALGLILFFVIGIVTNRISSGMTLPLRKLQDIMKSVDTGEFHMVGDIEGTYEVRELAREYDVMVGKIRELMNANVREQELKRKSDLKALQAQINPHFLYNTLDSIIWMGEMNQSDKVVQMTSALSKLFRISISKGRELIPISDEIAHVKSYLTIQEMRYRDSFTYEIDVDEALHSSLTLKITLQPLVENAIYHGIKEVDYPGIISISGKRSGDLILLRVTDNGKGMDPGQLEQLLTGSWDPVANPMDGQGTGVRNVHERVQLYFGNSYGLACESAPGRGTSMTVTIPYGFEGDLP